MNLAILGGLRRPGRRGRLRRDGYRSIGITITLNNNISAGDERAALVEIVAADGGRQHGVDSAEALRLPDCLSVHIGGVGITIIISIRVSQRGPLRGRRDVGLGVSPDGGLRALASLILLLVGRRGRRRWRVAGDTRARRALVRIRIYRRGCRVIRGCLPVVNLVNLCMLLRLLLYVSMLMLIMSLRVLLHGGVSGR